jgi:hypothetical protein
MSPERLRAFLQEGYMGEARAEEFGARNGVQGELLIRIRPTRVVAEENVAG